MKSARKEKHDELREAAGSAPRRSRTRKTGSAAVRLRDVARYAGVSAASVSRAINAPELVSPELRERITHAAKVLNWVPNGVAKALATLQSRTIGVIIPTLGHQNFSTLIETLQQKLAEADYTLVMGCASAAQFDVRLRLGRSMIERGIDALVLVGEAQPEALLDLLQGRRIPVVFTYTSGRIPGNTCIGFDNYTASTRITRHLLDLGHRRFAMIAASPERNDRIEQRIAGVKDTLANAGLGIRPRHFVEVDSSQRVASGREAFRRIVADRSDRPTALICSNDYVATGAMIEAAALGMSVPGEISIAGFDDVDLSGHLAPALTTIRVPAQQMGEEIARYVIRRLEQGSAPAPEPLKAELVLRGSTGPPPSEE